MIRQTDIPKVQPGESISRALMDQLVEGANTARQASASNGLTVTKVGGSFIVGDARLPKISDQDCLVEIQPNTAIGAGGGMYYGKLFLQPFTTIYQDERTQTASNGQTAGLSPAPDPDYIDCFVVNLRELDTLRPSDKTGAVGPGSNGTNLILSRMVVKGRQIGIQTVGGTFGPRDALAYGARPQTLPLIAVEVDVLWQPVRVNISSLASTGEQYIGAIAINDYYGTTSSIHPSSFFTSGPNSQAYVINRAAPSPYGHVIPTGATVTGIVVGQISNTRAPIVAVEVGYGTATISSHNGTGPTEWNPYILTMPGGDTAQGYNGLESVAGSPGSLGVNVSSSNGTVNGGTCVVQPLGTSPKPIPITWDSVNLRWAFAISNSAQ